MGILSTSAESFANDGRLSFLDLQNPIFDSIRNLRP